MRVVLSKLFCLPLLLYSHKEGIKMKFYSRKLAILSMFLVVVPLIGQSWAAFGPCVVYRPGGLAPVNSPIGCYRDPLSTLMYCFCGGSIAIIPEASRCSNANSVPCSTVDVEMLIVYGSDGSDCLTWSWYPFPPPFGSPYTTCGGACFQDPTTGWPTWSDPKDTSCN